MTKQVPITGDALRAWRKAQGLTQTDLGNLFGITQRTIVRYEKGELETPVILYWAMLGYERSRQSASRAQHRKKKPDKETP